MITVFVGLLTPVQMLVSVFYKLGSTSVIKIISKAKCRLEIAPNYALILILLVTMIN